ncbi:MAG: hypothetical protein AUH85_17100 [Chloroflexi bacterium 13_1_40CM_4_68_4]|nr:MAG: hypothetical protein AUH85_17100 [Chloroflexi bacterium 13_1_40CM_4_68_4]
MAQRIAARPDATRALRRRARGLPAWLLKLGSVCATLAVLLGSSSYASAHIYNLGAPLQPAVDQAPAATPHPTVAPARGRSRQVVPFGSTAPNLRTTGRAPLTSTHSS